MRTRTTGPGPGLGQGPGAFGPKPGARGPGPGAPGLGPASFFPPFTTGFGPPPLSPAPAHPLGRDAGRRPPPERGAGRRTAVLQEAFLESRGFSAPLPPFLEGWWASRLAGGLVGWLVPTIMKLAGEGRDNETCWGFWSG